MEGTTDKNLAWNMKRKNLENIRNKQKKKPHHTAWIGALVRLTVISQQK